MPRNILKFLTISLLTFCNPLNSQEIWRESFLIPEKGIWGDESGKIQSDFEEISTWMLEYPDIQLNNEDDYAKTVSTSGGRFEARDINGEVCWKSAWVDISNYEKISIELEVSEMGSGENTNTKYVKAFFSIDYGDETSFSSNSENSGNWGSAIARQKEISGNVVQVVVYISNHYATDKVIIDEVIISGEEKNYPIPQAGDIVINEILFNPFPDGEDYVEIYNSTKKEFQLKNLFLASRDKDFLLTQIYSLAESHSLLDPESYIALTKDTNAVFPFYFIKCPECVRQIKKMPSYNNENDIVVLLNENLEIIDEFIYSDDLHNPWLADVDGVSLERISTENETNDPENWTSANTESGYGTPGYKNSQKVNPNIMKPKITFEPEAFSPNFDGYKDEYKINYKLDKPGYIGSVKIFDTNGRFIAQLANNEILGTQGEFTWDGRNKTGKRQQVGMYVVTVEIFNREGKIYRLKDGVVLTDLLE